MTEAQARPGFSLVELLVALMILSVGILAMAGSTGYIMSQIRLSQIRTERMTAVREAAEIIRGTPWSGVNTLCTNSTFQLEHYTVSCSVVSSTGNLLRVQLVSSGPGYQSGRFEPNVQETMAIGIALP